MKHMVTKTPKSTKILKKERERNTNTTLQKVINIQEKSKRIRKEQRTTKKQSEKS